MNDPQPQQVAEHPPVVALLIAQAIYHKPLRYLVGEDNKHRSGIQWEKRSDRPSGP